MADAEAGFDRLLTPGEVAAMFRVDPKTVTRWANSGKVSSVRTTGGHHRFKESEILKFLNASGAGAYRKPDAH